MLRFAGRARPADLTMKSGSSTVDHDEPPAASGPARRSIWREARAALAGAELDYTTGPLTRAIWLLAIPMVLEMSMESTFAIVDVFFVARLGEAAVAAVGLTESLLTLVYALAFGFAIAATALIARRIGERNKAGAVRAATSALAIGVLTGVALGLPCLAFAPDLLRLMGASPSVVAEGSGYTRVLLSANVLVMLIHLGNGIFRGAGDAALAMRALAFANLINIVLDPCLIFGLGPFPELGLTGAAVATTIGRGAGVAYQIAMLRRGTGRLVLRGPAFRVEPRILLEILRLSAGTVGQFLIATSSWVVLMRIVAPFGETVLAGYTIAIRIVVFAFLPAWGFSNAAATLVGQNLGARRPERAERAVWLTGTYTMAFLALVTLAFLLLAPELVAIFTDQPETAAVAVSALRILSYGYVLYAWGMATVQGFNGAGDTLTPTWMHFFCFWLLEIPLAWALAHGAGLGPRGVFWSVCIAESTLAVAGVLLFRRGRWKETKLAADVPGP
jgi:putative MATE family efflux protein